MIKPVYTQNDFRDGRVAIKFEGNLDYLMKILNESCDDVPRYIQGISIGWFAYALIHSDNKIRCHMCSPDEQEITIPFAPEHEIYLVGVDLPTGEDIIPLRFSGGRDNSGDITSSQYYLIYKKKDCILNAIKSDDFIEFCKQLKIAKVKEKHIVEHNLSSDSLEKAFRFILPPKKKGDKEIYNHKPKQLLELHYQQIIKQMIEDTKRYEKFTDDCIEKRLKGDLSGGGIYPLMQTSSAYIPDIKPQGVGSTFFNPEEPIDFTKGIKVDNGLHGVVNIAKQFQSPENLKEEDLQFDGNRTHENVKPLDAVSELYNLLAPENKYKGQSFTIKRQPQFFVTDSVVEYSKLMTKFTPEAIKAMIEDGFLEVTQKYIPGKCR